VKPRPTANRIDNNPLPPISGHTDDFAIRPSKSTGGIPSNRRKSTADKPVIQQFTGRQYDLSDLRKREQLVSLLKKEWHVKKLGEVTSGPDATYERESLRFGCVAWSDRSCAAAGDFLLVFSEAGWKIEQNEVRRFDTPVPHFGIAIVTQPEGTEEQRQKLLPHQGLWHQMAQSEIDITFALKSIGITIISSSDQNLPNNVLGLYFGPEP
jgi:hypothetical protein